MLYDAQDGGALGLRLKTLKESLELAQFESHGALRPRVTPQELLEETRQLAQDLSTLAREASRTHPCVRTKS